MMNVYSCRNLTEIEDMARAFYEETRPLGGFDFAHLVVNWESIIQRGQGEIFCVEVEGWERVGMAGILLAPGLYGDFTYCQEAMLYVVPGRRRSWVGAALYRVMERWAKEQGAEFLTMVEDPQSPVNYSRGGYTMVERSWVKPLRKAG